jgi:hypothetical protein
VTLLFVPDRNPIQRVSPVLLTRLRQAQDVAFDRVFDSASAFAARVIDDVKLALPVPADLADQPAARLGDLSYEELTNYWEPLLVGNGVDPITARISAANLAQRAQLLRAFHDPEHVVGRVAAKVLEQVGKFPRTAADIECGRNAGDVIDPYILAATQYLLYGGDFQRSIEATVAHKALMIVEGLMGHLHEETLGDMRGNLKAPEPRGVQQEIIDLGTNPFPGADIVQPPTFEGEPIRLHQVKAKTGSAKGGDGKRLGEQLRNLRRYYTADVFYDALIGNTLRGHRSMNGVLAEEPAVRVLVGQAAFAALTRSRVGPDLLLRVYQNAFLAVARETGYRIDDMAAAIVATFRERADAAGEGFLELLLHASTGGTPQEQDSQLFQRGRRR